MKWNGMEMFPFHRQKNFQLPFVLLTNVFYILSQVKIAVFLKYARALGLCLFTWVFILMILNQGSLMFANIWLSQWTDDPYLKNLNNTGNPEYNTKNYIYLSVYGTVGIIQGKFLFPPLMMITRRMRILGEHFYT